VRTRLATASLLAVGLAVADVVVARATAHLHIEHAHHRSNGWVVLSLADCLVALLLTRIPSRLLAAGSALLLGGALGNLADAVTHHGYVANPFVIRGGDGGVAFNLADVFALTGIAVLVVGAIRMAFRYRHLLPQSTVAVRLARRLVR
jgi:hypothetical protein